MTIWVDADSCPKRIRDIVVRAAVKNDVPAFFVANRPISLPRKAPVSMVEVEAGEGSADRYIVEHAAKGDMVITRDIPLAADLVERSVVVLNDRGDIYTEENVRERLSIRDFMYELRNQGQFAERTRSFGEKEITAFSNAFDRTLQKLLKSIN